jgi:hypothetical protein
MTETINNNENTSTTQSGYKEDDILQLNWNGPQKLFTIKKLTGNKA